MSISPDVAARAQGRVVRRIIAQRRRPGKLGPDALRHLGRVICRSIIDDNYFPRKPATDLLACKMGERPGQPLTAVVTTYDDRHALRHLVSSRKRSITIRRDHGA